jgi:tRNA (guanine37-N1)-methyltransferase
MRFDVFTLFPGLVQPYLEDSILQRARQNGLLEVFVHDIRAATSDRHHVTDEPPYGGGGGMVMKCEPVFSAVESVLGSPPNCPLILLTPQGRVFNQAVARELSAYPRIALLCGRYEGIDERIRLHLITDQISVGDFVLTGGELPALTIIDAVSRLLPGVLGDPDGAEDDSHATGLLEYPHYTRPLEFRGWRVPDVLLSGNHALIAKWRHEQSILRTWQRRPDLLERAPLSEPDVKLIRKLNGEISEEEYNAKPRRRRSASGAEHRPPRILDERPLEGDTESGPTAE